MDSDPFDEISGDNDVKNARVGSKFQPKAKPRPPKRISTAPLVPPSQQVQTTDLSASRFTESCEVKDPSEPAQVLADNLGNSGIVNAPSDHTGTTENVISMVDLGPDLNIFIPESNEDWHSCLEKSAGENADIFIELESLEDFLPDSSAVLDNTFPSETPGVHVPGSSNTDEGLTNPAVASVDDSACFSNVPSTSSQTEISASQDPLTGHEAIISTSHDGCPTNVRDLEIEELESYPSLETLDMPELTNRSGRRIGKFQPKPKLAERSRTKFSVLDLVHPVPTVLGQQDMQSVPPEVNFVDQGSVPALRENDVLDFSSIGLSGLAAESESKVVVDAEETNQIEPLHPGAEVSGEHLESVSELPGKLASRKAKTGKSKIAASDLSPDLPISNQTEVAGRTLRKRKDNKNLYQLRDESDDEAVADGELPFKSPSISAANGNSDANQEVELEDGPQTKKVQKKSKKTPGNKEKPAKKRKKDNETSDLAAKAPKKFSHSTRRRRVNKTLLETPEDEIDIQKVPLRDLILLAEHKERMAKKDATASQAAQPNQSVGNSVEPDNEDRDGDPFRQYYDDDPFPSEKGGEANHDDLSPRAQENSECSNYHSHMKRNPVAGWSKQDTELFYEAVRQFGTDFSMIQQLFPDRTRRQVKSKYKKEEDEHPLRLRDALTNRRQDYSHFELVISRLRQLAEEENQNSNTAESVDLMGEEEAEEETLETNENGGKSEQMEEEMMENTEADITQVQSPVKTYDSEDDLSFWNQYKSED